MDGTTVRYRGREFTATEIAEIQARIVADPTLSRRRLSEELCRAWDWRQPNGQLRAMVCRGLLLVLHRCGRITLPPPRLLAVNNVIRHRHPARLAIPEAGEPITCTLAELQPLTFAQVRRGSDEALVDGLISGHHFLGYTRPVGEHLKFLVSAQGRPVACMAWSSAPRHLGPRDRFIGWSAEARRRNIAGIAYNTRFLVLPWVRVPHLASHVLGWMARHLSPAWEEVYRHPIHLLETFVDPTRNRGTCYRAANWICVGRTTGLGKDARTKKPNRSLKDIYVLPLSRHFRRALGAT
jgi:hypothetical protein